MKPGVRCKSCGESIAIDDEYLPGIRAADMAAQYSKGSKFVATQRWQKTLTCNNPNCRATHTYRVDDLRLLDTGL